MITSSIQHKFDNFSTMFPQAIPPKKLLSPTQIKELPIYSHLEMEIVFYNIRFYSVIGEDLISQDLNDSLVARIIQENGNPKGEVAQGKLVISYIEELEARYIREESFRTTREYNSEVETIDNRCPLAIMREEQDKEEKERKELKKQQEQEVEDRLQREYLERKKLREQS